MQFVNIDQVKAEIEKLFDELHSGNIRAFRMIGKYKQIIFTAGYFTTIAGRQIRYASGGNSGIYYFPEILETDPNQNEMYEIVKRDINRFLEAHLNHFPQNIEHFKFKKGFYVDGTDEFIDQTLSHEQKSQIMSEI